MPDDVRTKPSVSVDFTYRYTPGEAPPLYRPASDPRHVKEGLPESECVAIQLIEGNNIVVRFLKDCQSVYKGEPTRWGSQIIPLSDSDVLLEPMGSDGFPEQLPLALVLGCVDARAPAEIIFGMEFVNDVFNVRLAGNVVTQESLGSVEYALRNLVTTVQAGGGPSVYDPATESRRLRLLVALGHEGCGAIGAAVGSYQRTVKGVKSVATGPVASLLGHIYFPSLITAAEALDQVLGQNASRDPAHRATMMRLTTYLNAAWGSRMLQEVVNEVGSPVSELVGVVYGVFNPLDMNVRAIPPIPGHPESRGSSFGRPPRDTKDLREFADRLARMNAANLDPEIESELMEDLAISARKDDQDYPR